VADTAELTLGSTLAILSASWITQINHADYTLSSTLMR
jgi:hypothetical protein